MKVLINSKGELLEILQEPKEAGEDQYIVPLEGYYEVLNEQRFESAKWDFDLEKWVGAGEQRPEPPKESTELDKLKLQLVSIQEYVLDKEFQELKTEGGFK